MAVYIDLQPGKNLYGLLVGTVFINGVTKQQGKRWAMHLYHTEKGRRQGTLRQAREYPGSDLLTFELTFKDIWERAKLLAVIPKELHVDEDVARFIRSKQRSKGER